MLLAAKALVISRLLHKKLSLRKDPPPYLEVLRNRLATLRRKLLARIDRRLQSAQSSETALVEAMCAFSLATSSSPTDVLRHFHHLRQAAISGLGQREGDNKGISESLRLIFKTLRDCQNVFPAQLARALEDLKAAPLLHGSDVQSLRELNLEIHQRWLGEDINSFIPYVRHDDLQKTEATGLLQQWAKRAFSIFLLDLRKTVESSESSMVVVQLRQDVLELWLSDKHHSRGVGASDMLGAIRTTFNSRLQQLLHSHTEKLEDISAMIDLHLQTWKSGVSDAWPPMWDNPIISMDPTSGGQALKNALSTRAYGKTTFVESQSEAYSSWLNTINDLEKLITKLQETKWTDNLDDIDDDDDMLEDLQSALSEDDPHLLHRTLEDDLVESFQKLRIAIQGHADILQNDDVDSTVSAHKAAFLLRVWRNISTHLPSIYRGLEMEAAFTPSLQTQLSKAALQKPISSCDGRITKILSHKLLQARILWEGDPQSPVLPSPWAFRLLQEIVNSMAGFGADIWTPQATDILKQQLRDALAPIVKMLPEEKWQMNGDGSNGKPNNKGDESALNPEQIGESHRQSGDKEEPKGNMDEGEVCIGERSESAPKTNGNTVEEPPGPSNDVIKDMRIQRLFDCFYLDLATTMKASVPPDDPEKDFSWLPDSFAAAESNIWDDLGEHSNEYLHRMRKDAEAYWKRTELLFALLA